MISIITVNWYADDFLEVLKKKAKDLANGEIEFVVINNHKRDRNLGHGVGLNKAIDKANGEYILALDIDSHLLMNNWDKRIIDTFEKDKKTKLIAAKGNLRKPIRPCVMFFKRKWFLDNNFDMQPDSYKRVKFDVSILFFFEVLHMYGPEAITYLLYKETKYNDVWGNDYILYGDRFAYHNWYGTRWYGVNGEVKFDEIDGRSYDNFKKAKENLFKQI